MSCVNTVIFFCVIAILFSTVSSSACSNITNDKTICRNFVFDNETVVCCSKGALITEDAQGRISGEELATLEQVSEVTIKESNLEGIQDVFLILLPYLFSLKLKNNNINEIGRDFFSGCINLKKINLNGEYLIKDGAFFQLDLLENLNLYGTKFPNNTINKNVFKGLNNLKTLLIRNTHVILMEESFQDLRNLENLDLQSVSLDRIPENVFNNLSKLKILNLSGNNLQNLNWDEFQNATSLQVLFLERNPFQSIDVEKFLENTPALERIFFSNKKLTEESRNNVDKHFSVRNITVIYIS